jgi:SsrA-binding protein
MKKGKKKKKPILSTGPGEKTVATNRRARYEYHILERLEAGMVLQGTEVKSIREGNVSFQDAYAAIDEGEVWLHALHISPYECASHWNHDPRRKRKLLLHSGEIRKLVTRVVEKGFTLIPLRIYFVRGKAKLELGLAKGKKFYDKRQDLREKDMKREAQAAMRRT